MAHRINDTNPYRSPQSTDAIPTHRVILHNDPINDIVLVVRAIHDVFGYGYLRSTWLTLKVHFCRRGTLWVGDEREAQRLATQLTGLGPDPSQVKNGAQPLLTSVETYP